ncbi:MAG TPA: LacI family DNA-binding transcriptional regulator [Arachnia sp.]|jgi:DNA-binding LacI/PurR family transcriptional regulator|nr:LacI family DNA-binding transcriptional regulator [Propionibacteriaceae bacterium]HOA27805.1 LacI family DNA-binding transcriptional regulator [Arachnia sp.]HQD21875.1 LacI family DNA-binding transcriptional regulator [Arachnia sp.]
MSEGEARPAGRAPTIRDVAERAGVSKSLVSSVLQGKGRVSDASRDAIQQAIAELGYRPNSRARALSRQRSDTVGVIINDLSNPWFIDLLAGLAATLHSSGLSPLLTDRATDHRIGVSSISKLLGQDVDGLVLVGTMPDDEAIQQAAGQLPIVLAGTRDPKVPGTDIVVNDDRAGARAATEHLLRLGHTRIGHLSGPDAIGALRLAGFQEAMRTAGLDADAYHEPAGTSEEVGYAVARRLLTLQDRPTALLAFNDMTAIGALSAAYDLGLSVPEDLSLIGYDNTFVARIRHISLTSVDNGSFAVGAQAGRFLLERLTAPTLPQRIHQVPAELQVRGSTSTPR